ncbi:DNA/RNA helicase domain-containing protein [Acholeplasma laidlawii]|uniref:DNA/RNA helicase domain-containing protein n=1 Tax=Acholeplasma laidlawii TaxID=2148 RepID=UPI00084C6886|nr:DNA/RNA helicase domain-containing protein [Acholeplasma laidlawii]OED58997.1 hypothetical protein BHS12_05495 [Acholeplasma laidlawii]
MLAYNESIKQFNQDVLNNQIMTKISSKLNAGKSEQSAWKDAAVYMKNILELAGLDGDIEIGMELKIPITNNRIDFLIAGLNDRLEKSLIIIEMKRWSAVSKTDKSRLVNADDTRYGQDALHPSYQAYTYKLNLEAYNQNITEENIQVSSCSYLHNLYEDSDIKDDFYNEFLGKSPVFAAKDNQRLANFIKTHVSKAYHNQLLYQIENSKIIPAQMLMDSLSSELSNSKVFTLLDKQEICYQNIIRAIRDNEGNNQKQVFIVRGGAGTGKSVIAIKILNEFIQNKKLAFYVTKNSAVRNVYSKKLSGRENTHLKTLFLSTIKISRDRPKDQYECLVVDEAHRLPKRSKSGNILLGEDLIKEIIDSTKVSIFFIDEKQQVDIRDYATIERITHTAKKLGAHVYDDENLRLSSQFRCSGNDEYINAVESILYNEEVIVNKDLEYEVKVFDNIQDWHEAIMKKIEETPHSRMLAGDVFDWVSKDDSTLFDIKINGLSLQWNKDTTFSADESQKYRVGHIDTVQGLEFDYIGLIIGDDLIYNPLKGQVQTDYTKHPMNAGHFRRHGRRAPLIEDLDQIDLIIRNTYNVLMKRGMKGIYIYCMDSKLSRLLKSKF